jgi:hypothetical protein
MEIVTINKNTISFNLPAMKNTTLLLAFLLLMVNPALSLPINITISHAPVTACDNDTFQFKL